MTLVLERREIMIVDDGSSDGTALALQSQLLVPGVRPAPRQLRLLARRAAPHGARAQLSGPRPKRPSRW
jgi:hypothetical protein